MAKTKPGQRVALQLDPRIALEAIILNRLERTPTARRQEWLRSLLVQGFRSECLALRGMSEEREQRPAMAFTHRLAGDAQSPAAVKSETSVVTAMPTEATATEKPFAALGKVIG
jgi:hypothetical protein